MWLTLIRFVLTSKNYIRTVTTIKSEWLFEIAPLYYDLRTFLKGEVKSALERVADKLKRQQALNRKARVGGISDKHINVPLNMGPMAKERVVPDKHINVPLNMGPMVKEDEQG